MGPGSDPESGHTAFVMTSTMNPHPGMSEARNTRLVSFHVTAHGPPGVWPQRWAPRLAPHSRLLPPRGLPRSSRGQNLTAALLPARRLLLGWSLAGSQHQNEAMWGLPDMVFHLSPVAWNLGAPRKQSGVSEGMANMQMEDRARPTWFTPQGPQLPRRGSRLVQVWAVPPALRYER